ncbi:porin family protein [Cryomorphaceae bacterium 1068]|nr:porin family protein [Cryomorphaceae bacterium 1068]
MKNIILSITLVIFTFTMGYSQYLGLKGGLNFSNLNIEDNEGQLLLGYHAGAFLNIPLSDAFSVQPEVLFSTKGSKTTYNIDILELEGESTLRLNYIEVPLLGVLNLGEVAQINFGPYLGFLSTAKFDLEGDFAGSDFENTEKLDQDFFNGFDYGLAIGIALNFNAIQVGARYSHGLAKIEDSPEAELFLGDAQNRNVQAYIALRIGNYD